MRRSSSGASRILTFSTDTTSYPFLRNCRATSGLMCSSRRRRTDLDPKSLHERAGRKLVEGLFFALQTILDLVRITTVVVKGRLQLRPGYLGQGFGEGCKALLAELIAPPVSPSIDPAARTGGGAPCWACRKDNPRDRC